MGLEDRTFRGNGSPLMRSRGQMISLMVNLLAAFGVKTPSEGAKRPILCIHLHPLFLA